MHRKHLAAGHVLMSEHQAGEVVYLITEGAVRICVRRGDQDIIIGLRGVGDVLGEMSVLGGDRRSATGARRRSLLRAIARCIGRRAPIFGRFCGRFRAFRSI